MIVEWSEPSIGVLLSDRQACSPLTARDVANLRAQVSN
jgi:hypothetical protein